MNVAGRAPTADFDTYVCEHTLVRAAAEPAWVRVGWSDGHHGRFHHVWLRDNCPCTACVHDGTKEQIFELPSVPEDLRPADVAVDGDALVVVWGDGGPLGHTSRYDGAWLRAHCYSDGAVASAPPMKWKGISRRMPGSFMKTSAACLKPAIQT